ncbi:hypothetical protein ACU8V6_00135 [Vibrio alginolyticus]
MPSFVLGIAFVALFAVELRWFPVAGAGTAGFDRVYALTLPALTLAVTALAIVSRVTRQSMIEQILFRACRGCPRFGAARTVCRA